MKPQPEPEAPRRPGTVTVAAVLLCLFGALNALYGFALLGGTEALDTSETTARALGAISVFIAAVQVYAGIRILALNESARMLGIVVSIIGIALSVAEIASGGSARLFGLALNVYIVITLLRQREAFTR